VCGIFEIMDLLYKEYQIGKPCQEKPRRCDESCCDSKRYFDNDAHEVIWLCAASAPKWTQCDACKTRMFGTPYRFLDCKYCGECFNGPSETLASDFLGKTLFENPCMVFTYFGFKPEYAKSVPCQKCSVCGTEHPVIDFLGSMQDNVYNPDGTFWHFNDPLDQDTCDNISRFLTPENPKLCALINALCYHVVSEYNARVAAKRKRFGTHVTITRSFLNAPSDDVVASVMRCSKKRRKSMPSTEEARLMAIPNANAFTTFMR